MARFFNTAGPCNPAVHFMLPTEARLPEVRELMEKRLYFVVHAPRQSGKTTCFATLARTLTAEGKYTAVHASCERGQVARSDVERGVQAVLRAIAFQTRLLPEALQPEPLDDFRHLEAESRLHAWLNHWCERSVRPVVLFLDEIDALLDDTFSVLRQLREGYPDRPQHFPHSVVLIGLRDVRDYRAKIRPESETLGTASPFNVKAESLTLANFTAAEVAALYRQHTEATGQPFTDAALARAYELTRGQPWLVNALARQLVETLVPERTTAVQAEHVDRAAEVLIARRDTHLDSLIERLREPRVERVIAPILAGELVLGDNLHDDIASTANTRSAVAGWTSAFAGRGREACSARCSSSRCGAKARRTPCSVVSTSSAATSTPSASSTGRCSSSTSAGQRVRWRSAARCQRSSTRAAGSACSGCESP